MAVLKITVEDAQAETLKQLLKHIDLIKAVEEEATGQFSIQEPATPYEKLKAIQERIKDKQLFKEIEDPSEWQREIRKEWDRDF